MEYDWSRLNHLQLGKYGEYFAKMEFTKAGFDVFTAEVDNKGIDFVLRKDKTKYFDIQVKSFRKYNYPFMKKEVFKPRENLFLALVIFEENKEPTLLLIPSLDWVSKKHPFLVEYDYEGKKSKPEWGINISKSNLEMMKSIYSFEKQVSKL